MREVVRIQSLGQLPYGAVWQQLKDFTYKREASTTDEIWLLEHDPVFTQGQAGKPEHVLNPGSIAIVQSDRGGQVTYHGPGQLIMYLLVDIGRKKINVREFVCHIEKAVIELLDGYNIKATTKTNAPGVYVGDAKICSLGLRVRHGRTYHGLSLNVNMDLEPFSRINPCGFSNLEVVQISDLGGPKSVVTVGQQLLEILTKHIGYEDIIYE